MTLPILLFVASIFLWDYWIVYPIKLLTVFLHELSHGLAAVLTGGQIVRIEVYANQGGVCYTAGGSRIVVLTAGYLGSLLWGNAILLAAARTRYDRELTTAFGWLLIAVTLIWVRNPTGFVFGLLFGGGLLVFAEKFGEWACDQLLRWIGLTSSLYVILDIKDDLIDRTVAGSDAYKLAEMFHLPPVLVGVAWLLLALAISWQVLKASLPPVPSGKGRI